ncbi:MAG: CocE/NonD family hydrolase [Caldilinea sp. CFX5]|nr:CocE/NonD family hydrolase [Caldilinea sp. CFX5]
MTTSQSSGLVLAAWQPYIVDAPSKKISIEPARYEVVIERGIRIPMRDGIELAAILWRPKEQGIYPALVERAPHRLEDRTGPPGEYYAARGYAVLGVGLRGCSGSGGEFLGPMPGTQFGDGYDLIEWVAAQTWCNGQVGMLCGSISGFTQYQTAVEAPLHLKALLVREGPFSTETVGGLIPLLGLQFTAMAWTEQQLEHYQAETQQRVQRMLQEWEQGWQIAYSSADSHSPLLPVPDLLKRLPLYPNLFFTGVADYYNDWIIAPQQPDWQQSAELESRVDQIQIPICHLGGWFDNFLSSTLAAFTLMQQRAKTPQARNGQRLIIGPWVHGPMNTHGKPVGLLEFGPNAELDFYAFRQRWYDAHLRNQGTLENDPVVWLYLIGADRWLGFDTWPPPPATPTSWYLQTDMLTETAPDGAQDPDVYEYDPDNPVPTLAGDGNMGIGLDQRPIEHRLLTYTSAPLAHPLTLIGPVKAILYAASSACDTDWIVRVTMVRPDGASVILSSGVLRARYRHSLTEAQLLTPDQPERFEIEMIPVSIVIPAQNRLRFTVTSSDFPAFDRNLNTEETIGYGRHGQKAINRIYHDHLRPSHVLLPVLNMNAEGDANSSLQ